MAYPANTDYPGAIDAPVENRIDNIDIVWDDDFNFQAKQHEAMQKHIGAAGGMIGDIIPGDGISGAVSAVASGGVALRMLARASFSAGTLWSLEDDYDVAAQQKMRVNYAGRLWTADGADFSSSEYLEIPHGNVLPITFDEGRLFRKDDTNELYHADGAAWIAVGGETFEADFGDRHSYTQAAAPVEENAGEGMMDGSRVKVATAYFWAVFNPTFNVAGLAEIRLYDIGTPSLPAAPFLIRALQAVVGGRVYMEFALSTAGARAVDTIATEKRVYQIRVFQNSQVGDTVELGSAGIAVR